MGRSILMFYVVVQTITIGISVIVTFSKGEAYHILTQNDWMLFIIACGFLAMSEALEVSG